jgi:amino acid adenylation domain-containing protein
MSDLDARLASLSPVQRQVLETLLKQRRAAGPAAAETLAGRTRPDQPAPLSFGQERLWFLHRLDPDSSVYNVHTTIDVSGAEAPTVRRAIAEIVRRHDTLRTTFKDTPAGAVALISPTLDIAVPVVDLSADAEDERERRLARLAADHAHEPFDLERGPLVRVALVDLGEGARVLLLAMHHIITDGWSMDVFANELAALTAAFAANQPSPLAPVTVRYADFADWQRAQLQGARLDAELTWWRHQLDGAPPLLELPLDRPRPAVQSDEGAFQGCLLGSAASDRLHRLAAREATTLFSVLLSAFCVWLYRLTGQADLVVGLPVGGRTRAELEPIIGFFVNTVVLRTDVSGNPSFSALVGRVRKTVTDALAHQDLPFERLVAALAPSRHLSRAPLFQVMAQLLGSEALATDDSSPTTPGVIEFGTSLFDLSIDFIDTPDGIRSTVQYSTDLFEHGTITRWLHGWTELLEAVAADPTVQVASLPVMPASERAFVVEEANATATTFAPAPNISVLFDARVAETPDALALIAHDGTFSYAQLAARVSALAGTLAAAGAGPGTIVAVWLDRSAAYVTTVLAVLQAGAAYTPIDTSTPAARIDYVLSDTAAVALVTTSTLLDRLPARTCRAICVDDEQAFVVSAPVRRPATDGSALAYVIYTSGSTGRPKGVMVPQSALLNFVRAAIDVYGLTSEDRVLQFASIAFDTSIEEIFGSLIAGATLVVRTPLMLDSIGTLLAECTALGVTVLDPPTAFWHLLVQSLAAGEVRLPESVRLVIFGSERALPERLLEWDRVVGPRVRLMHGYGPTETTVVATVADLTTPLGGRTLTREVPIGRPVANMRVLILDAMGQPVPIGVHGEGWIGGEQVASGYLNQPDATAQAFAPDPVQPGRLMYRSGDRLSRLPDGQIMFHGRVDAQIKVRGYRIEPGEIESVLAQHPAVQECAVIGVDAPGGMQLVGCVTMSDGQTATPAELRAFLEGTLPAYMVPLIAVLDALPLTVTGKVDRTRLASVALTLAQEPAKHRRNPDTPLQRVVAEVWTHVLARGDVGLDDDFFELGGHSLLALQIVGRLAAHHGVDVPLRALFEHPRLEDFVRVVAASPARGAIQRTIALAPADRQQYRAKLVDGQVIVPEALRRRLAALASPGAQLTDPSMNGGSR